MARITVLGSLDATEGGAEGLARGCLLGWGAGVVDDHLTIYEPYHRTPGMVPLLPTSPFS